MDIDLIEMITKFDLYLASCLPEGKREGVYSDWHKVESSAKYLPVEYSRAFIDYQSAYWEDRENSFADVSLILYENNRPVGIWPLSLMNVSSQIQIGSLGGSLRPPIFDDNLSDSSIVKLTLACQHFLRELCLQYGLKGWESSECSPQQSWLSAWYLGAMKSGAVTTVRHDLFVDLSLEIPLIRQRFRERYKSQINLGNKLFNVGVLGRSNANELCGTVGEATKVWNEFKALHLAVAGRVTRSEKSWDLQYSAVIEGDAFLIYSRDISGCLVGGALFNISKNEGYYSVGAYDRSLFDKPIGHVIQFKAIEEMKNLGINFYRIGEICYPGENLTRTEKQKSIIHFKSGFSTHVFPRYIIKQIV